MDQCFKIHRYTDRNKGNKGNSSTKIAAPVSRKPADFPGSPLQYEESANSYAKVDFALLQTLCEEVIRSLKGKGIAAKIL